MSRVRILATKSVVLGLLLSCLSFVTPVLTDSAMAATVTATGTNPSVCNQEVGNSSNVIAYRLSGGDCVIEFKNVGTTTWTTPAGLSSIRALLVGGGGGGGSHVGGGGGGGGVIDSSTVPIRAMETISITVGAGGVGAYLAGNCINPTSGITGENRTGTGSFCNDTTKATRSTDGDNSSLSGALSGTVIAYGGGGGGSWNYFYPHSGGSGGGNSSSTTSAGTGRTGQGFSGGGYAGTFGTGGGGGATGAGVSGNASTSASGNGGPGYTTSTLTGSSRSFGGGGGGGQHDNFTAGTGVDGGGSGRANTSLQAFSGTANTGGGGGGSGQNNAYSSQGGNGGSGVVIIRYTPDVTTPTTSVSIAASYLTSGTSVSTVLTTDEALSSVTLYYSTSSNLSSPQSCGTTSNPTNGQTLTCTVASSDGTYYIYSRGTDSWGNVESAPVSADDSIIRDTTAPSRDSATVLSGGNQISLVYGETLSTTAPAAARFSVSDSGTARSVSSVSFADSRTITLTLSSAIAAARTVTLSYDTATTGALSGATLIEDLAGNDAVAFTNVSVTNNSTVTVPGAPTIGIPTAGTGQVVVRWTAPASNGGSAITDYQVQWSSDAGASWTNFSGPVSTSTSETVTGLTAGIAYKFRVSAINVVGTGSNSDSSVARTPSLSGATACGQLAGTGNPYQIHGGGSPSNEVCSRAFDNDTSTKYLNWGGSTQNNGSNDVGGTGGVNTSILIDLKSAWALTKVGLTTANDYSNRDPIRFQLFGSNVSLNSGWNLVESTSALSPPGTLCVSSCTGRFTDYSDVSVTYPGSYRYYKLKFTESRSSSPDPIIAVSEVRLYGNETSSVIVTYDSQGGSSVDSGTTLANGTIAAAPDAPTRAGYTFGGWSASIGGPAITFPYSHGQSTNFSLYARWSSTLSITTPISGLTGSYNSSFSLTVSSSGGSGGNTFSIASGSLQTGLSINSSTGVISGTPTQITSRTISVTVTDSSSATATTSTFTITINKASQSISISSLGTSTKAYPYSQALSITTTGSSGSGTKSYAIASGGTATGCSLSDTSSATATLSATTSGTCLITATIASDSSYESATSTASTFTFSLASQSSLTITSTTVAFGETLSVATSGGSGSGSISLTKVSGNCTVSGTTLTPTATGSCVITATKASDSNYLAETSPATTITITAGSATATISFSSTTFTFGITNTITITASTAGTVRFSANGKLIKYCKARSTAITSPFTATCAYRPSTRRPITITATLTPTNLNIAEKVSTSALYLVQRRTGARG